MVALLLWVAVAAPAAAAPEDVLLRLGDLGPGYVVNEHDCGLVLTGEENTPPVLNRVLEPPGCFAEFTRIWAPPGAARGAVGIESIVWPFADAAGAAAAFAEARTLTAAASGLPRRSWAPRTLASPPGDEAAGFARDRGRAMAAVLWRTGGALSLIFTTARSAAVAEASALGLARVQQARILAPAPLSPADYDDREVPLDDPELGVPVVWLGRTVQPDPTRPPLNLSDAYVPGGPRGQAADLQYGPVTVGLWRPRAFARFERTRVGRLVRTQRCARVRRIAAPGGRAVLHGGYTDPPRRCRRRPPDVWFAHVHLPDVVVTVNQPICRFCVQGDGPFDSRAGMAAVVAALRPRP